MVPNWRGHVQPLSLGCPSWRGCLWQEGCEERDSVVRVRGLLGPPSQGDHVPVHETQGLGSNCEESKRPFSCLVRPGESLPKAQSVFPNVEATKGTADKLGHAKA